jgi:phosphosulfolactate synthase (CoM biosynthesis protein A)
LIFRSDTAAPQVSYSAPSIDSLQASSTIRAREERMIKKVKEGYKVLSEKGKNLGGPYKTKAEAEKRLKQVEYFKHHK